MANAEQVAILTTGAAKWNEWVSVACKFLEPAEKLEYLDFSEADLDKIDLRGARLSWVKLHEGEIEWSYAEQS